MPDQSRPVGQLTIKISAMPADTNANGDIFGGWVMARMDQAGGIAGVERAQGRPMKVGDVLCVYTSIGDIGRTSMKILIEAWAQRFRTNEMEKVTDATFTFVAVDDEGRPRPIPR
jgi:acyl-CoA thioesterase YciA